MESMARRLRHPALRWHAPWVLLTIGVVLLVVAVVLAVRETWGAPDVVVNARSYAVSLVPADELNLVHAGRPRHALERDGSRYAGFRLDSSAVVRLGDPASDSTPVYMITSLAITPGCEVHIEQDTQDRVRIVIGKDFRNATMNRARQSHAVACSMRAGFTAQDPDAATDTIDDVVARKNIGGDSPASLTFRPAFPLAFRDVAVSRLSFATAEGSDAWRSAILDGGIELRTFDDSVGADVGDELTLGELDGRIVELIVGDTLQTLFKGTADEPMIAGVRLRPSMLEQAARNDKLRLGAVILLSVLGLFAAVFQAVLK